MDSDSKSGLAFIGLIAGLILLIYGAVLSLRSLQYGLSGREALATVTESYSVLQRSATINKCRYQFTESGRTFEGYSDHCQLPVGSSIHIYYLAGDPEVNQHQNPRWVLFPVLGVAFGAVFLGSSLFAIFRQRPGSYD